MIETCWKKICVPTPCNCPRVLANFSENESLKQRNLPNEKLLQDIIIQPHMYVAFRDVPWKDVRDLKQVNELCLKGLSYDLVSK